MGRFAPRRPARTPRRQRRLAPSSIGIPTLLADARRAPCHLRVGCCPRVNPARSRTRAERPVVYALHGFDDTADAAFGLTHPWINLPVLPDQAFAQPGRSW